VRRDQESDYREYVVARYDALRCAAYLLCRDWHLADDLVSITLANLYRHWDRVQSAKSPDAYVNGMLTHAWLDELRRPWRREHKAQTLPEPSATAAPPDDPVADRAELKTLLGELPPRQRAVVVLRYYCDLSVADTAEILGVTEGTVKAHAARGLDLLRDADICREV
jgi:RNA polymerase sigma-70 factor (sigma-E family)